MSGKIFSNMPPVSLPTQHNPQPVAAVNVNAAIPAKVLEKTPKSDIVETSKPKEEPKKERRGFIGSIKHGIANLKKTVATFEEYNKGLTKGFGQGIAAGAIIYTAGQGVKHCATNITNLLSEGAENVAQNSETTNFITKNIIKPVVNFAKSKAKGFWNAVLSDSGKETIARVADGRIKLPHKALAVGALAIAIGINLWNASLNATEKRSEIDHRWEGHKQ